MKRKMIVGVLLAVMLVMGGCGNRAQGNGSSEALTGTVEASVESAAESKKAEAPSLSTEPAEGSKGTEETKESRKDKADGKEEGSKALESGEDKKADKGSKASEAGKQSGQGSKATGTSTKDSGTAASAAPSQSSEESKPAAHVCDYGSGTVTTAATCTGAGVKTFTCSCGKIRTETIPAAGHSMKTDTTPATCTETGKSKTYCTDCGYVESEKATDGAKGHSFGGQVWVTAQSCTQGGYWNKTCSVCGYTEGGDGEPLGHEAGGSNVSEEPGCDYYGTREIICSRCGGVLYTEDIPAIPHIDENGDGECDRCHGPA